MPAVILDGTKIAAQIRAEVGEEVKQLTAEGLQTRARRRAGGPQSRVGDLRSQQGEGVRRAGHPEREASRRPSRPPPKNCWRWSTT